MTCMKGTSTLVQGECKSSPTDTFKAWAMDGHGMLKVKLHTKNMVLLEEEVVTIPFSTDYKNEIASLNELRKVGEER